MADDDAAAILTEHFANIVESPLLKMAPGLSLRDIAMMPGMFKKEVLVIAAEKLIEIE